MQPMEIINEISPLHGMDAGNIGVLFYFRDQYRRAILRSPPKRFFIEFLPTTYKGSHNHGMRISLAARAGHSTINWEYEIWRTWEDILWFQDKLEMEYANAARERRARLAQGKGVKAVNGMYKQDMASSFESLPPGPLPSSVAQDIHENLPRVSKKGTLFRPSKSTIDRRQSEFRALVEALFSDDMPSLIKELRELRSITDFFGFWRRDYDQTEKLPDSPRNVVSSSVYSAYFSESNPSLVSKRSSSSTTSSSTTSPQKRSPKPRPRSTGSTSIGSVMSSSQIEIRQPTPVPAKRLSGSSDDGSCLSPRPRALSNTSSNTSSIHSEGCSENGSEIGVNPKIVDDGPTTFDYNPQERCSSVLEVLPEEREMLAKSPERYLDSPQKVKADASSRNRKENRSWQVVSTPVTKTAFNEGKSAVRESTTSLDTNAEAILEGFSFSLPPDDSRASTSTFLTTDSTEAVIPREPVTDDNGPHPGRVLSLSDFEIYPPVEEEQIPTPSAFPFPSRIAPNERTETPTQGLRLRLDIPTFPTSPNDGDSAESSFECLPSPTTTDVSRSSTVFTASTSPTSPTSPTSACSLAIKAAHNSSIILLRISRETPFKEVRQRLYNKFVGQEGVPLSKDFAVAMVVSLGMPPSLVKSSSSKLSRCHSVSSTDRMELHFIDSQSDWEEVVLVKDTSKVTLRILDAPRM